MKKNIFVGLVILSFSFVVSSKVFAERGPSVFSLNAAVPMTVLFDNNSFSGGIGLEINRIILPGENTLMGVDYGATLSMPMNKFDKYAFPLELQLMFGILFVPVNFEKIYFGFGGALGMSLNYALPKGGGFLDSDFSIDFGVGGELRGGFMVTKKAALTFGCTLLYEFYKLDLPNRRYVPERALAILPSVGVGIRR